jgi:two-component system sensor histidine kinase DesK
MRWWRSRSQAARLDLCIRASFFFNLAVSPLLAGGAVRLDYAGAAAWAAVALTVGHSLLCALLTNAGIDHYLGRRPRPTRLIAAAGGWTVLGSAVAFAAFPEATPGRPDGPATAILLILVLSFAVALSTAVPLPVTLAVGALGAIAMWGMSVAQQAPRPAGPALALAALVLVVVIVCRVSIWMLAVVWELDRSRHVQASLAIAEERLRFARDLHDVVGRTLSVVALKSELAAQLARRGRAEAVEEMLEVRRIAQDSLAELRAVVRGYRSANLDVELAGARSLLASAGIECQVVGDSSGLPADVQGTLGWVVREATTNVLRHSEARGATITLHPAPDGTVTLTMDNDGAGSGPVTGDGRVLFGSGLTGLAERLAALGGTVTAELRPTGGFRLTARLPSAPVALTELSHA